MQHRHGVLEATAGLWCAGDGERDAPEPTGGMLVGLVVLGMEGRDRGQNGGGEYRLR